MNNIYPTEFYDFANGVPINDGTVKEWLKEVKEKLKDKEDGSYSFIGSGNTIVIGFKFEDEYSFIVADRYKEFSCSSSEIDKITF